MTLEDCAFIAELCAARAGLAVDPAKVYLIDSRLGPLARRESFASVDELVAAVRKTPADRLSEALVEAMVSSDSRFFRDLEALERVWREIVPEIARTRPDGVVRIWSAGCAAGQEIYSLAMLQAEAPAPTGPVELFASDLSERLLDRARSGLYSSYEVQRGLAARRLVRHFENLDQQFQVQRALRQQVRWRRVNLLEDLTPLGLFDVVLCRQVLTGLTPEARDRVLSSLGRVTASDGVLMLSAGEDADPSFEATDMPGVYRRPDGARAAA